MSLSAPVYSFTHKVLFVIAASFLTLLASQAQPASAVKICEVPSQAGEWDLADNASIDIGISFDVGDVATAAYSANGASVNITHTFPGDLGGRLISPDTTNIHLWQLGDGTVSPSTPSPSGCGLFGEGGYDLSFADGAGGGNLIQSNEGTFCTGSNDDNLLSGTGGTGDPYVFSRSNPSDAGIQGTADPIDALSSFVGDAVEGDWTMRIQDSYAADVGTINEVCLDLGFAGVDHEFFVSTNATCTDELEDITVADGTTIYVCQNVVNKGTETFEVKTGDTTTTLSTDLTGLEGAYAVRDAVGDTKTVVNSFTAGGVDFPVGVSNYTSGVTATGTDTNFTSLDTLSPAEGISVTVSELPPVTNGNISINGGSGTGGAFVTGDQVVVTWDASATGDTQVFALTAIDVDLSGWGGGASAAMTDTTACGGTAGDDVYEACYTLTAGSIDALNVNTSVSATNTYGTTGPVADTSNATVDNQAPVVTAGNLTADESACTGTGGACLPGDTVIFTWDNSALGDNNGDETTVVADLSAFGGSATQTLFDDGSNGDTTGADNIYTFDLVLAAGSEDVVSGFPVTVTDDAGTATGPIGSTDTVSVDTVAPTMTVGNLGIDTAACTGTAGACIIGNTITFSWDNRASADNNGDESAVTVDLSNFGGSASQVLFDDGSNGDSTGGDDIYTFDYTVAADDDDGTNSFTGSVTDDAGNAVGPITATATAAVDNIAPTVTTACISVTGAAGTSGAFRNGDAPVPTWNNNNPGAGCTDNNSDIATVSFNAANFLSTDTALAGTDAANVWTASLSGALDAQDDTNNNVTVTATDDAGNSTVVAGTNNYVVDSIVPTVTEDTAVTTPTFDTTPSYSFNSSEAGDLVIAGGCDTVPTTATSGGNAVNLDADGAGTGLANNTYASCTVQVTDDAGNANSPLLAISSFTVNTALDTDNDGVPDIQETSDGTSVSDATDYIDSDNDGVPDYVEVNVDGTDENDNTDMVDTDGDGHPDHVENLAGSNPNDDTSVPTDTEGDGVPDIIEDNQGTDDTNGTDYTDTDGDGVPDYVETGQGTDATDVDDVQDTDGNGVPDYVESIVDSTNPTDNTDMKDTDGDGHSDHVENLAGSNPNDDTSIPTDSDGDGVPDVVEDQQGTDDTVAGDGQDTDGDGVPDYVESGQGTAATNIDDVQETDGDGVPDYVENQAGTTDSDNLNYDDADGDGYPDHVENLAGSNPADASFIPTDTDNDGTPDVVETQQGTSKTDPTDHRDTDAGGAPDYVEIVLDQDTSDPADDTTDTDTDGAPDWVEHIGGNTPVDTDLDGVPDVVENTQGTNSNDGSDYQDTDGDGVPDYVEAGEGTDATDATDFSDSDGDGEPDYSDTVDAATDSDGDGVPDQVELENGTDPDTSGDFIDSDGDGHSDYVENLAGTNGDSNAQPADTDGDGVPDVVETMTGSDPTDPKDFPDTDGDGVGDYLEVLEGTDPLVSGDAPEVLAKYTLKKTVLKPKNRRAEEGDIVKYRIRIKNTGNVALDTVTVKDLYNTKLFKYKGASVEPDKTKNGVVRWDNALGDEPLAVGERRTIKVRYTVKDVPFRKKNRRHKSTATTNQVKDVIGIDGKNKKNSSNTLRLKKKPKDITYQLFIINENGEERREGSENVIVEQLGEQQWRVQFEDNVDNDFNDLSLEVTKQPRSTRFKVVPLGVDAAFDNKLGIRVLLDGKLVKRKIIYSTSQALENGELQELITDVKFGELL